MDWSVSPEEEIWFLSVCHHISNAVYVVYQSSRNVIIDFDFPILRELIVYITYSSISTNNRLLVVKFDVQVTVHREIFL